MPNRLANETSPYLLQHADNSVDWFPWGEEALTLAKGLDKPILLSIGYSACHWCHVMAHESFENPETAALMNAHFINIKVDREERPDIDQIYQSAHSLMSRRSGGWPLTMFLTPDQVPFYGGTYFPPAPRYNLPGFADLLLQVNAAYRERKADIELQSGPLLQALNQPTKAVIPSALDKGMVDEGVRQLKAAFDPQHGGFGGAPKFPNVPDWVLLMRVAAGGDVKARQMLETTLGRMACGGIYDQLAGGFCRYSVDERWEIPHFEKMLYDNGQLLGLYSHAWQLSGNPQFQRIVEETISWLLRDMRTPQGAFYAALDADSEGEEGKYYVWRREEIQAAFVPEDYQAVAAQFGLNLLPNFEEEAWHLTLTGPEDNMAGLRTARHVLLELRNKRVPPGLDDKILAAWNGLLITGLAKAARVFGREDWVRATQQAVDFIRTQMVVEGRLQATYKNGAARLNAYLDDHAFVLEGLLELMQVDFRKQDLDFAIELAEALLTRFEDTEQGAFHFTSHDHETLIQRPKSPYDNAIPSGNGIAALALLRLGHLLGETRYLDCASRALTTLGGAMRTNPAACPSLLCALQEWLRPTTIVVLRGVTTELLRWQRILNQQFRPECLVLAIPDGVTTGYATLDKPIQNNVNAWVCRGVECLPVISRLDDLVAELE